MSRGMGVLSGGVPPSGTAPMDGGRGKPLPYDKSRTASPSCVGESLGAPARIRTRSVGSTKSGAVLKAR